ncbi:hypothetical protein [Mucilaginibacter pedocola]|uniref:Uncharacterized protein n=1 Tax=Mucilaginibacter pedocola TaxID=1792845 RepID=A0A1S9PEG7_9SPHI|nr:hypothetical protein [Mucilaginibacter pedocola]OOQ59331.1 hypothetical protein BC343_27940 [Mucilaginibacter pedocola]
MAHILTFALHLFVVAMIAAFIVGSVTALSGTYDHWGNRYVLKARRSRLIRERARAARRDGVYKNVTPFKAKKINKRSEFYLVRQAA